MCDANRYVRQRSAWVLARMEPEILQILEQVVNTHDDYALQAFISELERSGEIEKVVEALDRHLGTPSAEATMLHALQTGRQQLSKTAAAGVGRGAE